MNAWILIAEAFTVYGLVLWSHSLRHRFGLAFFYALLGGLTAIMSWVTDANVMVKFGDLSFLVGSTVFYTSLLLGVFVVYVFDGPRATRVAILTVMGVSAMVPVISLVLHMQMRISSTVPLAYVPIPSLRINIASILTTLADLVFLAISWEYLHGRLRAVPLAAKAFLTLLGVMWLDVILFNTGAFLGQGDYTSIMSGTLLSRLIITFFAAPILWAYLSWQNSISGVSMPHRPVFAILEEISDLRVELQTAYDEIQHRKTIEAALVRSEKRYRQLIHNASEPIAVLQNDLYLLHNAKFLELTGLNEHDIQEASFSNFIHPDYRERVAKDMEAALMDKGVAYSSEFETLTVQGAQVRAQANMVGIDWDGQGALLAFLHDVTEQRRTHRKLIADATLDELTGVLNRRGFTESYEAIASEMNREHRTYSMLFLDIDQFKSINDRHGHSAGDLVLKTVARSLAAQVREGDIVGRMGGDEFAVLLGGADDREAGAVAKRVLDHIRESCLKREGDPIKVTVSIGYAQNDPSDPAPPSELLEEADKALLAAKRQGGNLALCS